MSIDIAVCLGTNGQTVSLHEKSKIIVYGKKHGKWKVLREKDSFIDQGLNIKELREKIKEIIFFLDDCRVFVGLSVVGVPYFELEKSNFSIWEIAGSPVEYLDCILEKEEEPAAGEKEKWEKGNKNPAPVETFPGCYRFSLKEIQENNMGITSKQALLPFLRKGEFYSLEVLCNHVPPWLEAEFVNGNLSGEIKETGNNEGVIIIIQKRC